MPYPYQLYKLLDISTFILWYGSFECVPSVLNTIKIDKQKEQSKMKIKLFNRKRIETGLNDYMGFPKFRNETNEELETRMNEFMAKKKVIDIKYQEATYGTYEDMDTWLSIIVMYEEVLDNE